MLIEFKVNFKLSIQFVLPILRRGKQFPNIILREQGTAQYPHDLYDWTSQFEVVFDCLYGDIRCAVSHFY